MEPAAAAAAACLPEAGAEWSVGAALASWRLLAALEAGTLLLVGLALLFHALRTRTAVPHRALRGQRVLITKGETSFSQELARHFVIEGCSVSLLADRRKTEKKGSKATEPAEVELFSCDTQSIEEVKAMAERVRGVDVLVICGADQGTSLDELAKSVSEEVYGNFHLLEELGGRLRAGGKAVWVSAGSRDGSYAGAARSLQQLARRLLHQVASRGGCRAVWCDAREDGHEALAARVVRMVARDGSLPHSADVFRELCYKLRAATYVTYSRMRKIWT